MSTAALERPRPGRPSTGARERILEACLEVLKADGYAGLTLAKVATRSGESKALVSYHFGSKQGLVAAAARALGQMITADVLAGVEGADTVEDVIRGAADGVFEVLRRDERLPRSYLDLNAVSVVDDEVRGVLREVKTEWRAVLARLLTDAGLDPRGAPGATTLTIATLEGFCLEWIERGDSTELRRARELFVETMVAGL